MQLPVKNEDKAFVCTHNTGPVCSVIKHHIGNGYASIAHCTNCKEFKKR